MKTATGKRGSTLNGVPATPWVLGTVGRVLLTGHDDAETWNRCWYEEYQALGGTSYESGSKGCPRAGARGLWYVGRLRHGQRPLLVWPVDEVYRRLTKNAAYSVITADLLATRQGASPSTLWPLVRDEFRRLTGEEPAGSEQGEVRLVVALHRSGELVPVPV